MIAIFEGGDGSAGMVVWVSGARKCGMGACGNGSDYLSGSLFLDKIFLGIHMSMGMGT